MVDKDKVKLIRLLSGEEIIAEVHTTQKTFLTSDGTSGGGVLPLSYHEGPITLKYPHMIIQRPNGQSVGLALVPWVLYKASKDTLITLRELSVVFVTEPHADLAKEFVQITSDILMPDKGIIKP